MTSEWTVVTTPPSAAERWASRVLRGRREGGVPPRMWPSLWPIAYFALNAFNSWHRQEWLWVTVDVTSIIAFALLSWQRYGFRLLLERYDAELEHFRARASSPV